MIYTADKYLESFLWFLTQRSSNCILRVCSIVCRTSADRWWECLWISWWGDYIACGAEPLCVRVMQLASFTFSFAYSYLSIYLSIYAAFWPFYCLAAWFRWSSRGMQAIGMSNKCAFAAALKLKIRSICCCPVVHSMGSEWWCFEKLLSFVGLFVCISGLPWLLNDVILVSWQIVC
jgi:hypothetical protein